MNTARMAILGVASLAGVCAVGVLAHGLSAAKPPPPVVTVAAPPPTPTVRVLVALRDIAVGERIQPADMGWQTWPADAVNASYVTDGSGPKAPPPQGQLGKAALNAADDVKAAMSNPASGAGSNFVGAIVREKITAHEPLIAAKVVRAGQSGVMAVTLEPGMRAVALPLTAESAAGGFILPGDHVDVLMTRSADSGGAAAPGAPSHGFITTTVMRNVRVLAVDQNMGGGPKATAAAIGATATVQATPEQAEYLVLAKSSGTLTLSLRSYADAAGGAEIGGLHREAGAMPVRVFRNSSSSTAATVAQ
jgi:pilus assembly protein CpaB